MDSYIKLFLLGMIAGSLLLLQIHVGRIATSLSHIEDTLAPARSGGDC